jgi:hypothetical protein
VRLLSGRSGHVRRPVGCLGLTVGGQAAAGASTVAPLRASDVAACRASECPVSHRLFDLSPNSLVR